MNRFHVAWENVKIMEVFYFQIPGAENGKLILLENCILSNDF